MIGTLLKAFAYSQAPKTTFVFRHPVGAAQWTKVPFDLRTAYAPKLVAVATALIVAPLAYRLGKRAGAGEARWPGPPAKRYPSSAPVQLDD